MKKKPNKNKNSKNTDHSPKKRFTKLSEIVIEKNTAIFPDTPIKNQDSRSVPSKTLDTLINNKNISNDIKTELTAEINTANPVKDKISKPKTPLTLEKVDNSKKLENNLNKQSAPKPDNLADEKKIKKVSLQKAKPKEKSAAPKYKTYLDYDKLSLPVSYGENKLVLIIRDSQKIFAYWDILHTKSEKKNNLIYITIYKSNDKSLNAKTGIQHSRTVKPAVSGSMYLDIDPLYRHYYGEITIQKALRSKLLSTSNTVSIPIPEKETQPVAEWKTMETLFRQMRQVINQALPDKKTHSPLLSVKKPEQALTDQKTTDIPAPIIKKPDAKAAYQPGKISLFNERYVPEKSQQAVKHIAKYIEKFTSEFETKITKFTGALKPSLETKRKITNWDSLFKKFTKKTKKEKYWERIHRLEGFYPKYFRK